MDTIEKIHLKCGSTNGSNLKGVLEPVLYSFTLDEPPGHKIYNEPTIYFLKKVNKTVLPLISVLFQKATITNRLILMEKR